MKKLSSAILILAAFTAAAAQAQEHSPIKRFDSSDVLTLNNGTALIIPHIHDAEGAYVRLHHERVPDNEWQVFSYMTSGVPAIKFNSPFLDNPVETVVFSLAHERAHHYLGHIRQNYNEIMQTGQSSQSASAQELAADCAAAVIVRDESGYGEADLRIAFSAYPAHENSLTHPPTALRLERAIACLNGQASPVAAPR